MYDEFITLHTSILSSVFLIGKNLWLEIKQNEIIRLQVYMSGDWKESDTDHLLILYISTVISPLLPVYVEGWVF